MDRSDFIRHDDGPETLEDISGVTPQKALCLRKRGIIDVDDVRRATWDQLGSIDGISNVLAARMKADVGGISEPLVGFQPPPVGRPIPSDAPHFDEDYGRLDSGPQDLSKRDETGSAESDEEIDAFLEQIERVLSEELDETDRDILRVLTEHLLADE